MIHELRPGQSTEITFLIDSGPLWGINLPLPAIWTEGKEYWAPNGFNFKLVMAGETAVVDIRTGGGGNGGPIKPCIWCKQQ